MMLIQDSIKRRFIRMMTFLGLFVCTGLLTGFTAPERDVDTGRSAAVAKEAEIAFNMGMKYHTGTGSVWQNTERALEWFRKAAELAHPKAQTILGAAYDKGEGVEQDYDEAFKWYSRAATKNDAQAQNGLAGLYAEGHGVERDDARAVTLYRKAAKKDIANAQYELGLRYLSGRGVEQDFEAAYFWLGVVALRDIDDTGQQNTDIQFQAMKKRDEAAEHLTDEQLKKLWPSIEKWVPAK